MHVHLVLYRLIYPETTMMTSRPIACEDEMNNLTSSTFSSLLSPIRLIYHYLWRGSPTELAIEWDAGVIASRIKNEIIASECVVLEGVSNISALA